MTRPLQDPALVRATLASVVACVALASCSAPSTTRVGDAPSIGILVVGDTGYHHDYLEREEYDPPRTLEQFMAIERADWEEDRRPLESFTPPPTQVLASNGGVVAASGLMPVARAMREWCLTRPCAFATMLGDNIYPDGATAGADGRDDATRFRRLFVEPYAPLADSRDGFRVYVVLGNHDWKTSAAGARAQLAFHEQTAPFFMDGFNYRVRPPSAGGLVELFVIDTEMLLSTVDVRETAIAADGRGYLLDELEDVHPWVRDEAAKAGDLVAWLDSALASSTARWKIVMGHHPLWSSAGSKFAQAEALRKLILPSLCRHADLYLAGHEHTLEAHRDDCSEALPGIDVAPLLQVVSGAGAKQRPVHASFAPWQQANHAELATLFAEGMIWGFAHITLTGDDADIRLVTTPNDETGLPVQRFAITETRRTAAQRPSTRP